MEILNSQCDISQGWMKPSTNIARLQGVGKEKGLVGFNFPIPVAKSKRLEKKKKEMQRR